MDYSKPTLLVISGPNGAGKTTTINMILGVLQPTSGSVLIGEIDLAKHRARALAGTNFAAVYAALPGNLTVAENLRFFGLLYGIKGLRQRVEELLPTLLGGVLLWDFCTRIMQGVSTAFLEDVWSRNFLNLFASPLSISEYIAGLVITSVMTSGSSQRAAWKRRNRKSINGPHGA